MSDFQAVFGHQLSADGDHLLVCSKIGRFFGIFSGGGFGKGSCEADQGRSGATVTVHSRMEVQALSCAKATTAGAGTDYRLGFMSYYTNQPLNATSTVAEVAAALESLPSVGRVTVYNTASGAASDPTTTLACPGGGLEHGGDLVVSFLTDAGDLPPLSHSILGPFREVTKGRRQPSVGVLPFAYTLTTSDATPTYVRVSAYTSVGFGAFGYPAQTHLRASARAPRAPTAVAAAVATENSVHVGWNAPVSDGGDAVESYTVECDRLPTFTSRCGDGPELATVTLTTSTRRPVDPAAGSIGFKLVVNGDYASQVGPVGGGCFPHDATAASVQQAIRALGSAYGEVAVSRGGDLSPAWDFGLVWTVTFHSNASKPLPLGDLANLNVTTCGAAAAAGAVFTPATLKDGLGFGGDCTSDLLLPLFRFEVPAATAAATADSVQALAGSDFGFTVNRLTPGQGYFFRVAASNNLGTGDFTPHWDAASLGPAPNLQASSAVYPAAVPELVTAVSLRSGVDAEGSDGLALRLDWAPPYEDNVLGSNGAPVLGYKLEVATRRMEVQAVSLAGTGHDEANPAPTGYGSGGYTLHLEGAPSEVTACLAWDAPASLIELEVNLLPSVDGAMVSASTEGALVYMVTFNGTSLSNGDVPLLVAEPCEAFTSVGGSAVTFPVTVAVSAQGLAGYEPAIVVVTTSALGGADKLDGYVAGMLGGSGGNAWRNSVTGAPSTPVSGAFDLSFGFTGDLNARLGGDNGTIYGKVIAGSYLVATTQDLRPYLQPGERVLVGGFVGVVNDTADYTCSDRAEDPNWPCTLPLTEFHPTGTNGAVELFGSDTSLGRVAVTQFNRFLTTQRNASFEVQVGDAVSIHNPADGSDAVFTVVSLTKDGHVVELSDRYNGSSSSRATAYKRKKVTVRHDASAVEVAALLSGLPNLGSVDVSRFGPTTLGEYTWSITFDSHPGELDDCATSPLACLGLHETTPETLTVGGKGCAAFNGTYASDHTMEDGRMVFFHAGGWPFSVFHDSRDGDWAVGFGHRLSPAGDAGADAFDAAAAAELHVSLAGSGDVPYHAKARASYAAFSPTDAAANGKLCTVAWGGVVDKLVGSASAVVVRKGTRPSFDEPTLVLETAVIAPSVPEVQVVTVAAMAEDLEGYFQLDFTSNDAVFTGSEGTGTRLTLAANASAADVEYLLESLTTIGDVSVTRTVAGLVDDSADSARYGSGHVWTVTFLSNLGDQPLLLIEPNPPFQPLRATGGVVAVVHELVKGAAPPRRHTFASGGLAAGTTYVSRVSAANRVGYGPATSAAAPGEDGSDGPRGSNDYGEGVVPYGAVLSASPGAPRMTAARALSTSQVRFDFEAAASNGAGVDAYRLEWSTDATFGAKEVKAVTVVNVIPTQRDSDGRFYLSFGGASSMALGASASAAEVAEALSDLGTTGGPVTVTRSEETQHPGYGYTWSVTFTNDVGPLVKSGFVCRSCVTGVGATVVNLTSYPAGGATEGGAKNTVASGGAANAMDVLSAGDVLHLSSASAAGYHGLNGSRGDASMAAPCAVTVASLAFVPSPASSGRALGTAVVTVKPYHGCNVTRATGNGTGLAAAAAYQNSNGLQVHAEDMHSSSGNGSVTAWTTEIRSGQVPAEFGTFDLSAHAAGAGVNVQGEGGGVRRAFGLGDACGSIVAGAPNGRYQRVTLGTGGQFWDFSHRVKGGGYRLRLGSEVTPCISHNATATEVRMALGSLGAVSRHGSGVTVRAVRFDRENLWYDHSTPCMRIKRTHEEKE